MVISDRRHGTAEVDGGGRWRHRQMVGDDCGGQLVVKVNGKRINWYEVRRYKIKGDKIGIK